MGSLSSPLLGLIFAGCAVVIWVAGIWLANATDALDTRLGIGTALGGLVLLSIATDLPELAITVTAAARNNLSLAVGNLVGGIAVQTLALVALDAAVRGRRPLSFHAASLGVVVEAVMLVAVVILAIMGSQLPPSANVAGLSPASAAIVLVWLAGLALARARLPWQASAPQSQPGRSEEAKRGGQEPQPLKGHRTAVVAAVFAVGALLTLAAGVGVEESGSELAGRIGLSGAVFGATILAASTALPELSTGLQSVRIGDHQLAFGDIFGGNAFLMVLFAVADLVAGTPALVQTQASDLWMVGLGVLLTSVYAAGILLRPGRRFARLGPDSWAVLALYALGIGGLVLVGQ
jgi:cation:H+ antiporter